MERYYKEKEGGKAMTLDEYQKKRDFKVSTEPKGNTKNEFEIIDKNDVKVEDVINDAKVNDDKRAIFVIHEHHATRLHWDLRLEMDGVLRSWAVPKDPIDVNFGTKRLAIHVEDHPIEYATFEGEIPKGSYGAGTVKIYDRGEFILEEETDNKLVFQLKGNKLNGKYTLVHVPNMGENSWLFIKKK